MTYDEYKNVAQLEDQLWALRGDLEDLEELSQATAQDEDYRTLAGGIRKGEPGTARYQALHYLRLLRIFLQKTTALQQLRERCAELELEFRSHLEEG
jgi:hypothetical protein